jgi:hypothetical protein
MPDLNNLSQLACKIFANDRQFFEVSAGAKHVRCILWKILDNIFAMSELWILMLARSRQSDRTEWLSEFSWP